MFREHLEFPVGKGLHSGHTGAAGGAICGDLVTIAITVEGDRVKDATFEASGCGAAQAAGSAAVSLVRGEHLFDAARVGTKAISEELGGLSPGKLHAADLASDALHQALGAAARDDANVAPHHRTLVAMSGGVDSAVAALLLDDAVAVTVELWRDPDNDASASCCSASAVRVARAMAHDLGLPHFTLDLREEFRAGVVNPWLDDHRKGLTPNPCVRCNGHVRLDAMVGFANSLGCEGLATGHYARKDDSGLLRAAKDPAKDQAYMLAATSTLTLKRLRFPLGDLTKPEVRKLAADAKLAAANKQESQDLCFLAGTGKAAFLAKHANQKDEPGDIVDTEGNTLGRHTGQHHFTVGQRKGLRLANEEPLYVLRKEGTTVVAGPKRALATTDVTVVDAVVHGHADRVRLRYRSRSIPCEVQGAAPDLRLRLAEPVDGVAPGQAAVLYAGDVVVGHGVIA